MTAAVALALPVLAAVAGPPAQVDLAVALGCGGCHEGVPVGDLRERAPALGPGAAELDPDGVFAYLADPVRRRPELAPARMPDFRLDEAERVALTIFLAGEPAASGPYRSARGRQPGLRAADGERVFRALDCAACHRHVEVAPRRGAPHLGRVPGRLREPWLRGYLADPAPVRPTGAPSGSFSRMPDYRLAPEEVDALLARWPAPPPAGSASPALTPHRTRAVDAALRDRLSCLGCHRLGGRGGGLGPPLDGIGERLTGDALRRVLRDPAGAAPGTVMPPPPLSPDDLERLARYLEARPGPWTAARRISPLSVEAAPGAAGGAAAPDGAALYARWCASCHGPEGRGDGWNAPALPVAPTPHASAELMARRPDDTLFDAIHGGAWVLDGNPAMPPFGGALDPAEIRALVAHIRRLCGCQAPGWSRDGRPEGT